MPSPTPSKTANLAAAAEALAALGVRVAVHYNRSGDEAAAVAAACRWVDAIEPAHVGEIHLAGYNDSGSAMAPLALERLREGPRPVLSAQRFKARGEAVADEPAERGTGGDFAQFEGAARCSGTASVPPHVSSNFRDAHSRDAVKRNRGICGSLTITLDFTALHRGYSGCHCTPPLRIVSASATASASVSAKPPPTHSGNPIGV